MDIKKNIDKTLNINCIGFNLEFDIILSLTQSQCTDNDFNFSDIIKLEDLEGKINENLLSLIKITSNDFLFNTILFINRANKIKSNTKYIIPFNPIINTEISFCENIIKNTLKKEGIEIIPIHLTYKKMQINFILNLLDNNEIISTKKFFIDNSCKLSEFQDYNNEETNFNDKYNKNIKNNKNKRKDIINEEDDKKLQSLFKALNKSDYILTSSNIINNIIHIFVERRSFEKILDYFQFKKLCIIYDDFVISDFTKKIMSVTDIFIFEKKILDQVLTTNDKQKNNNKIIDKFINYFTNEIVQKEDKTIKMEIIIDQLKEIEIILHDSICQLVIGQTTNPIFLYQSKQNNKKEEDLIHKNYNFLKSVYIGGFLSRLFYKKSFNTCLEAAVCCTKKVLKILKEKEERKYININGNNFKVKIKRKLGHSQSLYNFKNYKMEEQFILDGKNICEMNKKKEYNAIFDNNCMSFFNSNNRRNILYKNGFINKEGRILADPRRLNIFPNTKKRIISLYQKELKQLYKIKNKKDISQKLLEKISRAKIAKIDGNFFNLDSFNEFDIRHFKKDYFLPSVKEEKNFSFFGKKLYNKEVKNNAIIPNIKKRYFKGISLNKIVYSGKNDNKNLHFGLNKNIRKKNINSFESKYKYHSIF